ncbi:MAG TPA: outer membrane beta-barrel protein [Candidatus Bacteroides avicola]|jgi:hypothetical protein|uniref:Outer membrane beta-barrel protein n=1 Tax=Candidatus Bacteroides avicola TaxID=2838468 RepID=A0A9D2HYN0_9BACE|nr:outer membrane beta-barrel protein [Mediterranea sp. An20]MBW9201529.1 hypothetical protein [Bacteroidales bacterium SW292]OUP10656.1 hypothetical protein B5F34_04415 [Mediterranea sp. An20]HJA86946.1 outer membrane beta-barrel protein [Candidatus Bacteroides avicola]
MKRIYVMLLLCTCAAAAMAQGQKFKQRLIDRDYYPIDSAKVTVKGTNISTVTDKDGNFILEDVPLILDSIEVTKGKKSKTLPIPLAIEMKQDIQDRFMWFVKAGWGANQDYDGNWSGGNFYGGVGMNIAVSRHWFYELGVYYFRRQMNLWDWDFDGEIRTGGVDYETHNLEIPVAYGVKYSLGKPMLLAVKFGAYYSRVLSSSINGGSYYDELEGDDRDGGGLLLGLGLEVKRHWLVDIMYKSGWTAGDAYMDLTLGVGYRF